MNFTPKLIGIVALALLTNACQQVRETSGEFGKSAQQRFANALHEPLHRLEHKGAILAARVIDLETGQQWYAENVDMPMIPASNGKLAISAAALDLFGPGYTFKTYMVLDPVTGDLWLVGSGDPGCGDERIAKKYDRNSLSMFDDFAAALRRRGVSQVKGNLYYWDNAFDEQLVHPNWKQSFLVDWYAAPVAGLNFNDNCIDVTAHATEDGKPADLNVVPPNSLASIDNQTVSFGDDPIEITREPSEPVFTVKGGIKDRAKYESKPITDPGAFFANAFKTHLASQGITIAGEVRRAESLPFGPVGPMYDRIVSTHETSIIDILWRINKNSQNLFAEAMSKAMGREMMFRRGQSVPGSWQLGEEVAKEFLQRHNIDITHYAAADGSGLARENQVTARLISDLLVTMWRHPHGKAWRESLAVAGVDGTIGKRMHDMEGRVMAKTGYIGGVRSLSGYVHAQGGNWLAFSFIFNNIEGSVKPYEQLQDDACRVMYYWPNKPVYPRPLEADSTTQPSTPPAESAVVAPATQPADTQ